MCFEKVLLKSIIKKCTLPNVSYVFELFKVMASNVNFFAIYAGHNILYFHLSFRQPLSVSAEGFFTQLNVPKQVQFLPYMALKSGIFHLYHSSYKMLFFQYVSKKVNLSFIQNYIKNFGKIYKKSLKNISFGILTRFQIILQYKISTL